MRIAIVTLVVLLIGCGGRADDARPADRAAVDQLLEEFGTPGPRDSALVAPRLITGPTLVVFWLTAADTLHPDDAASALDDMNYYTEQIMPRLTGWGVALVPTNADTLYIALPNQLHAEYTVRAARHGIHVLCEKPMAMTEKDCRAMIRACERNDVRLMVAYRLHFDKANLSTVDLIRKVTEGRTLVMVEHDMSVVFNLADRISVLVYGEVIATGTPAEIRASKAVQEAYLGTEQH